MREGAIIAQGKPSEIVTEQLVKDAFGLSSIIIPDPVSGTPLIVPKSSAAHIEPAE
jgi:iron complex transport system ATP-binding protein